MDPLPASLQAHARDLAKAFGVRLIEADVLEPHEALGIARLRVALCTTIIDETTYAVALHEMGHLIAPTGVLRDARTAHSRGLMLVEEDAAWTWARHYALIWTPIMETVATWAEGTYTRPIARPTPPPAAPATPAPPSTNWKHWK